MSFKTWRSLCPGNPTMKAIAKHLGVHEGAVKKYRAGIRSFQEWPKLAELDQPENARLYAEARAKGLPEEIPGPPKVTAELLAEIEKAALLAHRNGLPDLLAGAERQLSRVQVDSSGESLFCVSYWPPEDPSWVKADHEAQDSLHEAERAAYERAQHQAEKSLEMAL